MKKLIYILLLIVTFSCSASSQSNSLKKEVANSSIGSESKAIDDIKNNALNIEKLIVHFKDYTEVKKTQRSIINEQSLNKVKLDDLLIQVEKLKSVVYKDLNEETGLTETTLTVVPYNPPVTFPAYLTPFTDPNFGSTVTRISDDVVFGSSTNNLRHEYSLQQAFNSDGTKIMLWQAGSKSFILDSSDYSILQSNVNLNRKWSNTNPNLTYNFIGTQFRNININNPGSVTVVRDFSSDGYDTIYTDAENCEFSSDDTLVGLMGRQTGTSIWDIILYNWQTNSIEATVTVTGTQPNSVKLSHDKQYIVVDRQTTGSGDFDGINVFTKVSSNLVHQRTIWSNTAPHSDTAVDQNGNQVIVLTDMGKLRSYRLDGVGGETVYNTLSGGHVSGRAYDRPGWVYVTDHGYSGDGATNNYGAYKEIYAVKLDEAPGGVVTVNRFTKHYVSNTNVYNHQPQGCPNRDGTKVIFSSSMSNASIEAQTYPRAFVVEKK